MLATDIYRPDQWRDFFVMVEGAAAVLTGLVFVALSLNLGVILHDATHRSRSIGTLMNLGGIFVICALALMGGQSHAAIGVEWLLVSSAAGFAYLHPVPRLRRANPTTLATVRLITGGTLYAAQIVAALVLLVGASAGLYIAATAMTLLAVYAVTGAWLLVVGAQDDGADPA
jgi:modulator of FtsH protease